MDWHRRFLQQAAWTGDIRTYLFKRAGLLRAQRVLEVGCGTGAILSRLITSATVHGLDLDLGRLLEARLHAPLSQPVCGDTLALPYATGIFDITFCHFLLLWVSHPLQALLEMKRVTRPGGAIMALAEPDHTSRVDKPDVLAPLGRWQTEALQRQGADVSLGSRLADLFRQADIRIVETGTLQESDQVLQTPGDWALESAVLQADLAGFVPPAELSRLILLDKKAWKQGSRVLRVPTYFAWGNA
jgi:SAM-dependent methyltransferase